MTFIKVNSCIMKRIAFKELPVILGWIPQKASLVDNSIFGTTSFRCTIDSHWLNLDKIHNAVLNFFERTF